MEQHKYVPASEASTSNDFFSMASYHPRFSQLHSESSRRKSTPPVRIQPVPTQSLRAPAVPTSIRVQGVIRDPSNSKCLYLLVNSSDS